VYSGERANPQKEERFQSLFMLLTITSSFHSRNRSKQRQVSKRLTTKLNEISFLLLLCCGSSICTKQCNALQSVLDGLKEISSLTKRVIDDVSTFDNQKQS
jgi:hypothetical protein